MGAAALPPAQTISVKSSSGTPAFTTAILPAGSYWVTASPNSGMLPGSISVRVNPTSLPVGAYSASVNVTVTGVGAPVVITVTLNIVEAPSTLTLSQTTLSLAAPSDPAPQIITMTTNGAPISFTATSGSAWMTVSPMVGVVLPGDAQTLMLTVTAGALMPQTAPYVGKVTVVASGASVTTKSQNITVNLTVSSVTPAITNIWPSNLPMNAGNQTLTIYGTSFYSSTVAKVQGVPASLATTVLSTTALLAVVPAALLTASGTLQVMVTNPAPGGNSGPWPVSVASAPAIAGLFNAASYASATVSPGELVTMFGTNIGPAIPAPMVVAGGYASTTVGGVSVTIDGQSAPILYVSANQVTVQVPYEVTTGTLKNVVLTNGANPPANAQVTIASSVPGIFSADGSGTGEAAALNTTSAGVETLNGSTNPATIGETVTLYLTGEGDYNAPGLSGVPGATNTGYIIPVSISPLPTLSPGPTVTIGGIDASAGVSYAGVVPGSILGILQINVVVPTGSATGASVPVTVSIGGNATQSNITLAIHP